MDQTKNRILFVDDDAELREIVKLQLMSEGYDVQEAENGEIAMQKLAEREFDLILLDILMPHRTGLDVLKYVREKSLSCQVIMLTGVTGLSTAIESLSMGASDYITKPYNLEYLLSSIKRVLGSTSADAG